MVGTESKSRKRLHGKRKSVVDNDGDDTWITTDVDVASTTAVHAPKKKRKIRHGHEDANGKKKKRKARDEGRKKAKKQKLDSDDLAVQLQFNCCIICVVC